MKKIPVLVTFFNRPAILEKLLKALNSNNGIEIFYASDGARDAKDLKAINLCWELIDKYSGRVPDTHKLLRDSNLGCKNAMIGNIDWFLGLNDFGIILEDDCVPNDKFFGLIGNALKDIPGNNPDYISVSGSDYLPENLNRNLSAFRESIFPQIWGWGTWARKWRYYQPQIPDNKEVVSLVAEHLFKEKFSLEKQYFKNVFQMRFDEINKNKIDTWDYSLTATAWRHGFKALQINGNQIVNSGFGALATHTITEAPRWVPKYYSKREYVGNSEPGYDRAADIWMAQNVFNCKPLELIKNEIKKAVRR